MTPAMAISRTRAYELMLLAIEAADDALVGYTNHSYGNGESFERLFIRIVSAERQP
jgi:hypothetical protein